MTVVTGAVVELPRPLDFAFLRSRVRLYRINVVVEKSLHHPDDVKHHEPVISVKGHVRMLDANDDLDTSVEPWWLDLPAELAQNVLGKAAVS